MEPFIGEVRLLPYTFEPPGWLFCNGQILPIRSNAALFSILGNVYGGDGKVTFALPNLQGCVVPGTGLGPGLQQDWTLGLRAGTDTVTLNADQMPQHNHYLAGLNNPGNMFKPMSSPYLARDKRGGQGLINYLAPAAGTTLDKSLNPQALSTAFGGSQAHENRQPYLVLNFCIAVQGLFPQRP